MWSYRTCGVVSLPIMYLHLDSIRRSQDVMLGTNHFLVCTMYPKAAAAVNRSGCKLVIEVLAVQLSK